MVLWIGNCNYLFQLWLRSQLLTPFHRTDFFAHSPLPQMRLLGAIRPSIRHSNSVVQGRGDAPPKSMEGNTLTQFSQPRMRLSVKAPCSLSRNSESALAPSPFEAPFFRGGVFWQCWLSTQAGKDYPVRRRKVVQCLELFQLKPFGDDQYPQRYEQHDEHGESNRG